MSAAGVTVSLIDTAVIVYCAELEAPALRKAAQRILKAEAERFRASLDPADVLLRRAAGGPEVHVMAAADELVAHLMATEADLRLTLTSSASTSSTVRLLPSGHDSPRALGELSQTFSACCFQTLTVMNRPSPSRHSFAFLSNTRGTLATRNRATGRRCGVNLSSGSAVRWPTTVI